MAEFSEYEKSCGKIQYGNKLKELIPGETKIVCVSNELAIDEQNRVWPCGWVNMFKYESSWQTKNQDKDWNSLDKHSLDSILKHDGFTTHYNDTHWEDPKSCDEVCKRFCLVKDEKGL